MGPSGRPLLNEISARGGDPVAYRLVCLFVCLVRSFVRSFPMLVLISRKGQNKSYLQIVTSSAQLALVQLVSRLVDHDRRTYTENSRQENNEQNQRDARQRF